MYQVVKAPLSLYLTFKSQKILGQKLLVHCFEGKWCEICSEQNWGKLGFNKRLPPQSIDYREISYQRPLKLYHSIS